MIKYIYINYYGDVMSMSYIFGNIDQFFLSLLVNILVNPLCYLFIVFGIVYKRKKSKGLKVAYILFAIVGVLFLLSTLVITFFDVYVYPIISGPLYLWLYPRLFIAAYRYLFV